MRTRPDERFKRWARALRAPAFKAGAVSEALSRAGVAPVFNAGAAGFSRDWPSHVPARWLRQRPGGTSHRSLNRVKVH